MNIRRVNVEDCPETDKKTLDKGIIEIETKSLTDNEKERILAICHKHKHLYLDGYPHGKKTRHELRKKGGIKYEKWIGTPQVCITYLLMPTDIGFIIESIIGNLDETSNIYTQRELFLFMQNWQQDVVEDIISEFNL